MYFLLNDVVLTLDAQALTPPIERHKLAAINLDTVSKLGAELYSEDPLLHQNNQDRAKRLAALILSTAPNVNAALFVAPAQHCAPGAVSFRYAELSIEVMGGLHIRQRDGSLSTVQADKQVWRRLAA